MIYENLIIENCTFQENNANDFGGALQIKAQLSITQGKVKVLNCNFLKNVAYSGGGIYIASSKES